MECLKAAKKKESPSLNQSKAEYFKRLLEFGCKFYYLS
jgi:hypothetical protein